MLPPSLICKEGGILPEGNTEGWQIKCYFSLKPEGEGLRRDLQINQIDLKLGVRVQIKYLKVFFSQKIWDIIKKNFTVQQYMKWWRHFILFYEHCWKWTIRFQFKTLKLFLWNIFILRYNLNFQKMPPRKF